MKWKVILVVLLVVAMAGCTVTMTPSEVAEAEQKKVEAETIERIRRYEIVKEEQQLITDILKIRYEAALLKAKFNPPAPNVGPAQPLPQNLPPVEIPNKE